MNDREPPTEPGFTRRALLAAISSGAAAGLAGCAAGENEITSSSTVLGHSFPRLPETTQLNPWSTSYPGSGFTPVIFEFLSLRTPGAGYRTAALVESVGVEASAVTVRFDDSFLWWNGEPVTARDRYVKERIQALRPGTSRHSALESVTLEDEYTLRYELSRSLDRPLAFANFLNEPLNTARWVFQPWVERFEDATSRSQLEDVQEDLREMTISLEEAAERGFGCGPYEFQEISSNRLLLERFEDHPRAADISIPRLWLPVEHGSRIDELIQKGWLDTGQGSLDAKGVAIPDNLEQLAWYSTTNGWKIALNWENEHLARRNVRRAILSALPLPTIIRGADWGTASERQTGLARPAERRWLDPALRESLHRYPLEADDQQAAAYMRAAGYERRRGDRWFGPGGDRVQFRLLVPVMFSATGTLLEQALDDFGFVVEAEQISNTAYFAVVDRGNYDLLPYWTDGRPHWAYDVTATSEATLAFSVTDPATETSRRGKPITVSIPSDPGDVDAEPDRTINLVEQWDRLRGLTSTAETEKAVSLFARWWNYDLPDIEIATEQTGVWGNTRDFDWPEPGHRAYRTFGTGNHPEYYLMQAGLIGQADE